MNDPIRQRARQFLEESAGDINNAKQLARQRVDTLIAEFGRDLIVRAIDAELDSEWRAGRQDLWKRPRVLSTGEMAEPSERLRNGIAQSLMNYPMPGGRLLRELTKADVLEASANMIAQGKETVLRGEWLQLVARELRSSSDRVGDVLTEADLKRLQRRILKKDAA